MVKKTRLEPVYIDFKLKGYLEMRKRLQALARQLMAIERIADRVHSKIQRLDQIRRGHMEAGRP